MDSTNNTLTPDRLKEKENKLVVSYKTLRNLIGYCGMILPIVLILTTRTAPSDKNIESSFSDYYYTSSGDILVSFLCILGAFLFIYKGYNIKENIHSTIAGICGILAAFSPTAAEDLRRSFSVHTPLNDVPEIFGFERHTIVAGLFFITLGVISLLCFPQTDVNTHITTHNKKRNNIFKICGWTMLMCVLIMAIYFLSDRFSTMFGKIPFIFIMETIATWAFGISWLTIGETIYPDGEHYLVLGYKAIKQLFRNSFINSKK
jgi:MFS family permease